MFNLLVFNLLADYFATAFTVAVIENRTKTKTELCILLFCKTFSNTQLIKA